MDSVWLDATYTNIMTVLMALKLLYPRIGVLFFSWPDSIMAWLDAESIHQVEDAPGLLGPFEGTLCHG